MLFALPAESRADDLPSPLSLAQALQIAAQDHPKTAAAQARVALARAKVSEAEARDGFDTFLELYPKRVKTAKTGALLNDGTVHFGARHVLIDFGSNSARQAQYQYDVTSQELLRDISQRELQLATEKAYYDVLLSDLRYTADNEEMTVNFLIFDKLRERHSLGRVSEVDLARAEHEYRVVLNQRKIAETQQRITRQRLAMLLNRPDDVPSELIPPTLQFVNKKPPDPQEFFQRCLPHNPLLQSLRETMKAKQSSVQAEARRAFPTITAEVDVTEFQRELDTRNNVELGLRLKLPLYQSGLIKAKTAQAVSDLQISSAELQLAEQELQQEILELVLHLEALQVQKKTTDQELNFRDIEVDKRRAQYELEIQTNMGSAIAKLTKAQWLAAKIDYEIELTWKRLNALLGEPANIKTEEVKP